jgi:hypothetical protein
VVLGNFNLSEIIRFAEGLKGLANPMLSVLCLFLSTMFSVFRSQAALQVEILALRHQIGVLRRSAKKRPKLTVADRDVLTRIGECSIQQLDDLLPHRWAAARFRANHWQL